jgi:hypothetical protein
MNRTRSRRRAIVLLGLLLLGLVEWWAASSHRLSPADVARIHKGMTRADVEVALGQQPVSEGTRSQYFGTSGIPADDEIPIAVWECSGGWIAVFFTDGRVDSAALVERVPPWNSLRRRLGW